MPEAPRGRRLFLNRDRSAVVPAGSPDAAVMMHERDVKALGIEIPPEEKAQEQAGNKARRTRGEDKGVSEPQPEPQPEPEPEPTGPKPGE